MLRMLPLLLVLVAAPAHAVPFDFNGVYEFIRSPFCGSTPCPGPAELLAPLAPWEPILGTLVAWQPGAPRIAFSTHGQPDPPVPAPCALPCSLVALASVQLFPIGTDPGPFGGEVAVVAFLEASEANGQRFWQLTGDPPPGSAPEPTTIALFGLTLLLVGWRWRRSTWNT